MYAVVLACQVSYIGGNFGTLVVILPSIDKFGTLILVSYNLMQYCDDCVNYQINA